MLKINYCCRRRFLEKIESVYSVSILLTIGSNLGLTTLTMYAVVMEADA